ncbi:hypothetical protein SUDANB180_07189 [Streptomyces sp. enrichment culture]
MLPPLLLGSVILVPQLVASAPVLTPATECAVVRGVSRHSNPPDTACTVAHDRTSDWTDGYNGKVTVTAGSVPITTRSVPLTAAQGRERW